MINWGPQRGSKPSAEGEFHLDGTREFLAGHGKFTVNVAHHQQLQALAPALSLV
jgi:hypothetical protein